MNFFSSQSENGWKMFFLIYIENFPDPLETRVIILPIDIGGYGKKKGRVDWQGERRKENVFVGVEFWRHIRRHGTSSSEK